MNSYDTSLCTSKDKVVIMLNEFLPSMHCKKSLWSDECQGNMFQKLKYLWNWHWKPKQNRRDSIPFKTKLILKIWLLCCVKTISHAFAGTITCLLWSHEKKQSITEIDFTSGSRKILITEITAGQLHSQDTKNNEADLFILTLNTVRSYFDTSLL